MIHPPDPAYPTTRFRVAYGWRLEATPLSFERGRITHTDGVWVEEFW